MIAALSRHRGVLSVAGFAKTGMFIQAPPTYPCMDA